MARDIMRGKVGGVLKTGIRGNIAAINTPQNAHLLTATRKGYIRKIILASNGPGADGWVRIGTALGVGFVDSIPRLRLVNNFNLTLVEDEIPNMEFLANITIQSTVQPIEYQLEVEEVR